MFHTGPASHGKLKSWPHKKKKKKRYEGDLQ